LRIEFPGALHHVYARGNGRQRIFLDSRDRERFFELLEQCVGRFAWLVHTYCLMDNHYHLFVETPEPNLARGMRQLNGVYAQAFNRRHRMVGHLFQSRYGDRLVQGDGHVTEVVRYIVRNPLRARICVHPGEWPWSSYNATMGAAPAPRFLTSEWVLGHFGADLPRARERFAAYVLEPDATLEPALGGLYQGDEEFARLHAPGAPIPEIPRRHTRPVAPPLAELLADGSPAATAAAYRHGYSLGAIARQAGRHYTTISRRLKRFEADEQEAGPRAMR
jgi:REP element-mobilizing transposase RayT